jgi:hypothetical protein
MGKAKARFDMDGDGDRDDTGWVGKRDGILVVDRDGDGRISGPDELSMLPEKAGATSELDALVAMDTNKDGKLDASDARFSQLKIWVDADGDGVTDAGELRSLADHDIASIGLSASAAKTEAKIGDNVVLSTGLFTRTDGTTGTFADAALAFRPGQNGKGASGIVDEILKGRLESLGSGLDRALQLDGFDWNGSPDPVLPREGEGAMRDGLPPHLTATPAALPAAESGGIVDARTALMIQDMAAFGARSGEADRNLKERGVSPHFDYFAQ